MLPASSLCVRHFWRRSPLGSMEVSLSFAPQWVQRGNSWAWRRHCFYAIWIAVPCFWDGWIGSRLEIEVVLHQGPEIFGSRRIWACSIWCQQRPDETYYLGRSAIICWCRGNQATVDSYLGAKECSGEGTHWDTTHGDLPAATNSAATS
jgi:hypothetical protein